MGFDRDGFAAGMGSHPFDTDGSTARTDVPQEGTGVGGEGGEGERSDFTLGELAVVLVNVVGETGSAVGDGATRVRWAMEGDRVELGAVGASPLVSALGKLAFGGTV